MDIIGGIAAATEGLKLVNELRKIDAANLKLRRAEVIDQLPGADEMAVAARWGQGQPQTLLARFDPRQIGSRLPAPGNCVLCYCFAALNGSCLLIIAFAMTRSFRAIAIAITLPGLPFARSAATDVAKQLLDRSAESAAM